MSKRGSGRRRENRRVVVRRRSFRRQMFGPSAKHSLPNESCSFPSLTHALPFDNDDGFKQFEEAFSTRTQVGPNRRAPLSLSPVKNPPPPLPPNPPQEIPLFRTGTSKAKTEKERNMYLNDENEWE
ncbi:hypothetical protein niasHT_004686 [Heterodera trifolii]|uniref:Uncharacterized protein n=1 Tax=Heterodera trifolii TaxID=157864 RepID=A0ABD2M9A7_9BILA